MALKYLITGYLLTMVMVFAPHSQATEHDPGVWTIFSTTDSFPAGGGTGRWHYWFDAQARYFDIGSGTNQWLVRPAIGYEVRDGVKVWAGYARFRSRNAAGRVADENRYWQQLDWRAGRWQGGDVSMRVRLEQRSVDVGDDLRVVLRFMTKYVRPFANREDRNLIVSLEPFMDLRDTDWGGDAGLGQNRIFAGMGWRLSDKVVLETGYMNQYIWVDGAEDRINHLAIVTIKARL
jgi:hypothetical protein